MIQMLEKEKGVLLNQVDELQLQLYTLNSQQSFTQIAHKDEMQTQIDILQSEITRLQFQMIISKETWAEENNFLRTAIQETERLTIQAKMQYAEAATDREIYFKQYKDLKESKKSKISTFNQA